MAFDDKQWLDIGPAAVVFNSVQFNASNTDNPDGGTFGGIELQLSAEEREALRDAMGASPYDVFNLGLKPLIRVPFTGLSLKQLQALIPGATLSTGPADKQLTIKTAAGYSHRTNAQSLTIKPIIDGAITSDESKWIVAALASPSPDVTVKFARDEQKVYMFTFHVFASLTTGALLTIGDDAAS